LGEASEWSKGVRQCPDQPLSDACTSVTRSHSQQATADGHSQTTRAAMDADLYDHLTTTITTSPDPQQHLQPSGSAVVDDNATADTPANDPRTSPDEGPSASPRDSPRRQRTMSSSLPEEIDQVVQAISSSQWAARLGNLVGSVKRQVT
jgi:hypothetical protein